MKQTLLALLLLFTPFAWASEDCLTYVQEEMNTLHRHGSCCEDAVFTSISSSMIGWGIGLAAGIALLTGLVHQSKSSTAHSSSSN